MTDTWGNNLSNAEAFQRVGPLVHLPGLLREFGVSMGTAVEGIGLDPSVFDDPERRLPFRLAAQTLARCAILTACPHLGLLLGARSDERYLGFPGQVMANSSTLGEALSRFVGLQAINSGGGTVYLHRSGEQWVFGYGVYSPETVGRDQIYPLIMAMMCNIVQRLTGGAVKPVEVLLPVHAPGNVVPHIALLGPSLRFNQSEAGVVLQRSALDAVIPSAKPAELEHLRQRIASQMPSGEKGWSQRVSHAIRPVILRGQPTTAKMAAALGLNVRALARRLQGEGTTFQQILDGVRFSMARELLHLTDLTVAEVSDALSYSNQSSFGEAFRRWSGATPSAWREKHRQAEPAGVA